MPVQSLGYIHLDVVDVEQWSGFATDLLGMMPAAVAAGDTTSASFRIDHFPSRLTVHRAAEPGVRAIGFEVLDRTELAEVSRRIEAFGTPVQRGSTDLCRLRQVTGLIECRDPGGNQIEIFFGPILDHVPVVTPLVTGFVTGSQGMGHVIVSTPEIERTYEFYTEVLGFWERNSMSLGSAELFFLACNERHHTLGILPMPGPGRLIHIMVEAASLDDVGRAYDRVEQLGIPMQQTLGRHTNDHMVSFYVFSPEQYAIEMGWGGLRIAQRGPTYSITQGAFWGHRPVPPPG